MKDSEKNIIKLQESMNEVVPEITKEIERRISLIMEGLSNNEEHFADLFLGAKQETQDCTKLFQYIVTPAIMYVCMMNKIKLEKEESDGYDWIFHVDGEEIKIEQKVKTILKGGRTYESFIKQDKLVNDCWTGNKAAANGNSKTDIHLLWCFELFDSSISSVFATLVSLKKNGCEWKTGKGKKDSFANLSLNPHADGVYPIWGDLVFTGHNNRPLKKTRCWLQEID